MTTARKSAESKPKADDAAEGQSAQEATPEPEYNEGGELPKPEPKSVTYRHKVHGTETTLARPHKTYEGNDNWERV